MIAYIRGVLAEKSPTRVVVEATGVGYELLVPVSTFEKLPREGEETKLLAAHVVREDDEMLFGFFTPEEKELFLRLTAVSGVGPKIALSILSGSSVSELAMTIAAGDAKRLSTIKGVGRKTAEKICVELKDKVSSLAFAPSASAKGAAARPIVADAVAALRALGFSDEVSSKMVAEVLSADPSVNDIEKVIKRALASR